MAADAADGGVGRGGAAGRPGHRRAAPATIPFERLYITYHIRSVAGLDGEGAPIYRDAHQVVIDIPPEYPEQPPVARMASGTPPPFHPNFWNHGANYGLICTHGGGVALADPHETLA